MRPLHTALLGALALLSACGPTRYTDYRAQSEGAPLFERAVAVHVGTGFYRPPPDCAIVMPVAGRASPMLRRLVEDSVHRHLVTKLSVVVGPGARARAVRSLAIDVKRPDERAVLLRKLRCPVLIEAKIWDSGEDFALVWSRKNLDLEIIMVRHDTLLWKARHNADRADGGLPLSPISAPFAVAKASRLHGDGDAMVSLVDDAVRRIVASLPDTRVQ